MKLARRFRIVAALVLSFCAALAQAQTPVRILIGYPPGGDLDVIARALSDKLGEAIGRPVVVETRAGASGRIAAMALKSASPDGTTLMLGPDTVITLNTHTVNKAGYDALKDFVAIANAGSFYYGLAVGAGVPAKNFKEWVDWARADKKNAVYGSPSVGGSNHLFGTMLAEASGVPLVNVPYRGVTPAVTDLVAGQLPAVILNLSPLVQQARLGKIRLLAHSAGRQLPLASEVPTFKELGYPGLEISGWYGIFAPAKMSPELVARYNDIIVQALRTPAVRERISALYLDIVDMTPAQIAAKVKAEYEYWGRVVKASGFSADSR